MPALISELDLDSIDTSFETSNLFVVVFLVPSEDLDGFRAIFSSGLKPRYIRVDIRISGPQNIPLDSELVSSIKEYHTLKWTLPSMLNASGIANNCLSALSAPA